MKRAISSFLCALLCTAMLITGANAVSIDSFEFINDQNRVQAGGYGMFTYNDNWLYGPMDRWGNFVFSKVRGDGTDKTVMAEISNVYMPTVHGLYIYFVDGQNGWTLKKIRTSGGTVTSLNISVNSFQIVGDTIYYTDTTNFWLHSCDLDGNSQKTILNKAIYYPYIIGDQLLYQEDSDSESLHVCKLNGSDDKRISQARSYWPIYDGTYVYYVCGVADTGTRTIRKVHLDGTGDTELYKAEVGSFLALNDGYLYFNDLNDDGRVYRINTNGNGLSLVTQDSMVLIYQFLTPSKAIYVTQPNNWTTTIYMCNVDGSGKQELK